MEDRSKMIYGNEIGRKAYGNAIHSKKKFIKKYGDDTGTKYPVRLRKNAVLGDTLGIVDVRVAKKHGTAGEKNQTIPFDTEKGIIVGNIRMGFGHYRISMAIASAAHAMGYVPYWMDLNSYGQIRPVPKVIRAQNDLILHWGQDLSQKSRLFNRFVWEPMNYEGFSKADLQCIRPEKCRTDGSRCMRMSQRISRSLPRMCGRRRRRCTPGMKRVVNAIPDNWPDGACI